MNVITNYITIEQSSNNPYANLGHLDAQGTLVKADSARQIGRIIKARRLPQQRAVKLLGMTQPKALRMLHVGFRVILSSNGSGV